MNADNKKELRANCIQLEIVFIGQSLTCSKEKPTQDGDQRRCRKGSAYVVKQIESQKYITFTLHCVSKCTLNFYKNRPAIRLFMCKGILAPLLLFTSNTLTNQQLSENVKSAVHINRELEGD